MKTFTKEEFRELLDKKVRDKRTKTLEETTDKDLFYAIASIIKDAINEASIDTKQRYIHDKKRRVSYLSMEFLIGRLIESNLINTGFKKVCDEVLMDLGRQPREVYGEEQDAGLGNGGLGRLAACFLDSIASLGYAGHGFGIRYRYGLFEQRIVSCSRSNCRITGSEKSIRGRHGRPMRRLKLSLAGKLILRWKMISIFSITAIVKSYWLSLMMSGLSAMRMMW